MSGYEQNVLTEAFCHNEAIWRTTDDVSEMLNVWRMQKIILAQKVQQLSPLVEHEVLRSHENKCTMNARDKYFEERIAGCNNLLKRSRRTNPSRINVFKEPQNQCEPPCRGLYESCKHNELKLLNGESGKPFRYNIGFNPDKRPCGRSLMPQPNAESTLMNTTKSLPRNAPNQPTLSHAEPAPSSSNEFFRTAREQQILNEMQKKKQQVNGELTATAPFELMNFRKKTLGVRRGVNASFVPPIGQNEKKEDEKSLAKELTNKAASSGVDIPKSLAHLDEQMVEQIMRESMHNFKNVDWNDIAGLESAKTTFLEAIILPLRRPDLYTGVRCPPRGVLLFGPPGTGKTLIAKSIASQAKAKFFSINPSSLTSKWVGEGEKLVRTLFAVAAAHQPAIIFIDEVDSLLSKRSGNEHESSLRLKNEFLIHLDGATTSEENRILVIGATNRPQELDEAVRRRFVRRLYIPLPDKDARKQIIIKIIGQVKHNLTTHDIEVLSESADGYSGADVDSLCRYASMAPLRALSHAEIDQIQAQQLPAVTMDDFKQALRFISKTVSPEDIERYISWNEIYGIKH
ncbi:fidgetin-like protein 1 [Drosophila tropicalis]|uniref:fidgetin-like protein 1 n=1 Tax=Drosophila tropicalis TaxID=46794 RepID=UPI0035AB7340